MAQSWCRQTICVLALAQRTTLALFRTFPLQLMDNRLSSGTGGRVTVGFKSWGRFFEKLLQLDLSLLSLRLVEETFDRTGPSAEKLCKHCYTCKTTHNRHQYCFSCISLPDSEAPQVDLTSDRPNSSFGEVLFLWLSVGVVLKGYRSPGLSFWPMGWAPSTHW